MSGGNMNTLHEGSKRTDLQKTATLEDAIQLAKHGKFHHFLLFGCGCCVIAMVQETFIPSFVIPAAQCDFLMGPGEKGLLNAITYLGMISSSHLWGYLSDTKGRRKMLLLALFLDGVCAVLSSLAHKFWLFVLLRFFNGFFICAPSAVVFAYIGEFHSSETRTRAIMFVSVFLSIGGLCMQGIGWAVLPQQWILQLPGIGINFSSWRIFIVIGAIPSFFSMVLIFILPESPKYLFSIGKDQEALEILRRIFIINTGCKGEQYPVTRLILDENEIETASTVKPKSVTEVLKNMWHQTVPLFQKQYIKITTLAFFLQFALFACYNGFSMWTPDIFNRLSKYGIKHPNNGLTICETVLALKAAVTTNPFLLLLRANETLLSNSTRQYNLLEQTDDGLTNTSKYDVDSEGVAACTSQVNPAMFRDTLIIVFACMFTYSSSGIVVKYVEKKYLMATSLLVSSVAGGCMYIAQAEWLVVALASVFISLPAACINVLSSIVVESIPTQLRAMAVCLSLMCGRCGVMVFSLILGILLETSCWAVFALLFGAVLSCCLLCFLLPKPTKS